MICSSMQPNTFKRHSYCFMLVTILRQHVSKKNDKTMQEYAHSSDRYNKYKFSLTRSKMNVLNI